MWPYNWTQAPKHIYYSSSWQVVDLENQTVLFIIYVVNT